MKLLSYDDLKAAKGIGYSRVQLWRLEKQSEFPKRVPLGRGRHGWAEHEIDVDCRPHPRSRSRPDFSIGTGRVASCIMNHNPLVIVVTKTSPGQFEARHEGVLLCTSHQPFLDGCRVLLACRHDPKTIVTLQHAGSNVDALRSRLGVAAKLRVRDNHNGTPVFSKWIACGGAASPPIAPNGEGVTTLAAASPINAEANR